MPASDLWPQPVLDLLAAHPDRPVVEHGDRVLAAAELTEMIGRLAAGLRSAGIGPGDGVALDLRVSGEAFAAVIAAFVVGAQVCGMPPGMTSEQRRQVLESSDSVLITDVRLAELLTTPAAGGPLRCAGRFEDVARVIYTSGSTGHPKGCAQTYAAMSAAWAPHPDRWPPAIRDLASRLQRYLVFGSLSSQVMLEYGVLTLAAGGTLVVVDRPEFPDALTRHRASASVITVGKLHQLIRDQQTRPVDLTGLRALMVSGSPLEPGRLREALTVLGPVVFHGYGQTETGMIAMVTPDEMLASEAALSSVGRPPAVVQVQVRDEHGRPVEVGEAGELFVRTPAQASGYWADPDETAEVFTEGWIRTRDLARQDAGGRLRLLGRVRDVIIVNANLLYAGPIERALAEHPLVAEAYVVGSPDEQTGEAIHAYIVPHGSQVPDPTALRRLVADRLGPLATPQTVSVIDRVPVLPSGKPDKRALVTSFG